MLSFWGALVLFFELFKRRKLHLHLAAVCCPRYLTEAELEMTEGGVDAKVQFENDEVSSAQATAEEESKLLSGSFDMQFKKLVESIGDSFVRV